MPRTRSHVVKYLKPLNDRKRYVNATILKRGRVIALASECLNYQFNQYIFPEDMPIRQVVKYLKDNKGWKPSVRKRIEHSLEFIDSRNIINEELYKWEYETVPRVMISFQDQQAILEKEITEHKIPYSYDIVRFEDDLELGRCSIHRRSGWVSQPFHVTIGLNYEAPFYVVLHELAHLFAYYYYRSNTHSPIFLTLYSQLLKKYMDMDSMASMKDAGLLQGLRNGR